VTGDKGSKTTPYENELPFSMDFNNLGHERHGSFRREFFEGRQTDGWQRHFISESSKVLPYKMGLAGPRPGTEPVEIKYFSNPCHTCILIA
jgi:hypothetical protein